MQWMNAFLSFSLCSPNPYTTLQSMWNKPHFLNLLTNLPATTNCQTIVIVSIATNWLKAATKLRRASSAAIYAHSLSISLSLYFSLPLLLSSLALCTTSVTAGRRTLTWTRTWAAFSIRFDLWSLSARARALCLFLTRSSFLPQLFALPFSYALLVFWPRLCSCWVCVLTWCEC